MLTPTCQGTMSLKKLALLWIRKMKEEKARKINRPKTRRRNKDGKEKKRKEDTSKIQKVGSPEAHGERPFAIGLGSVITMEAWL